MEQEIEVMRVICSKCGHYRVMDVETALKQDESFKCELCYVDVAKGEHRVVRQYDQCAGCGQVLGPDRMCYCPEKNTKSKWIIDPKHVWIKTTEEQKIKDEIEDAKSLRLLQDRVNEAKEEPNKRQERIEKLLEQLVKLSTPNEAKQEVTKKVNHNAIG